MLKEKARDACAENRPVKRYIDLPMDFRARFRNHLLSRSFQKAFEETARRSMRTGNEAGFSVEYSASHRRLVASAVMGGKHRGKLCSEDDAEATAAKRDIHGHATDGAGMPVVMLHTHMYALGYTGIGHFFPSPPDCNAVSIFNSIGLVVPINEETGTLEIAAFQSRRRNSASYGKLLFGMLGGKNPAVDSIDAEIARRQAIRLLRFPKRDAPNLTPEEVDAILDVMKLRFNNILGV